MMMMLKTHGETVRLLLGFLYPSYKTITAVMTESREDDLLWLKYWSVLSLFSLVELLLDPLVHHFTWYLLAKCVFLIWCMAPMEQNGSNLIFSQVYFVCV